jgi:hypothetical protein
MLGEFYGVKGSKTECEFAGKNVVNWWWDVVNWMVFYFE